MMNGDLSAWHWGFGFGHWGVGIVIWVVAIFMVVIIFRFLIKK